MTDLVALMGMPACGKSSFVDRQREEFPDVAVVSPDRIRKDITGDMSDQSQNELVFDYAHALTKSFLWSDQDVIFDATNLTTQARNNLLLIAQSVGVDATLFVFRTPYAECCRRNALRERVVPEDVMALMADRYIDSLKTICFEPWKNILFIDPDD